MSAIEAVANVVIGYSVAVVAQMIVFPWFGIVIDAPAQLAIGGVFTVVSIVRSYLIRRMFEVLRQKEGG